MTTFIFSQREGLLLKISGWFYICKQRQFCFAKDQTRQPLCCKSSSFSFLCTICWNQDSCFPVLYTWCGWVWVMLCFWCCVIFLRTCRKEPLTRGDCKFSAYCCIANTRLILVFIISLPQRKTRSVFWIVQTGIGHSATTQRKTSENEYGGSLNAPAKVQHECDYYNNSSSEKR